jgi:uncharacterized phosphosugar-binding protein
VVESFKNGGKFYAFGSGHSHMIAEELYIRAGGLAWVHAILPPELMLHQLPTKSTFLERQEGYAKGMLELYHLEQVRMSCGPASARLSPRYSRKVMHRSQRR